MVCTALDENVRPVGAQASTPNGPNISVRSGDAFLTRDLAALITHGVVLLACFLVNKLDASLIFDMYGVSRAESVAMMTRQQASSQWF